MTSQAWPSQPASSPGWGAPPLNQVDHSSFQSEYTSSKLNPNKLHLNKYSTGQLKFQADQPGHPSVVSSDSAYSDLGSSQLRKQMIKSTSNLADQTTRIGQLSLNPSYGPSSSRTSLDSVFGSNSYFGFPPGARLNGPPLVAGLSQTEPTDQSSAYQPAPPPPQLEHSIWSPFYSGPTTPWATNEMPEPSSYACLNHPPTAPGVVQPQSFSAIYENTNSSQDGVTPPGAYGPGPSSWFSFQSVEEHSELGSDPWSFVQDATPASQPTQPSFTSSGSVILDHEFDLNSCALFAPPPSPTTPVSPTSALESPSRHSFEGGRSRPSSSGGRSLSCPTRVRRNSSSSISSSTGGRGTRKMHPCPYDGCGQSCQPSDRSAHLHSPTDLKILIILHERRAVLRPSALVGHIRVHTKEERKLSRLEAGCGLCRG